MATSLQKHVLEEFAAEKMHDKFANAILEVTGEFTSSRTLLRCSTKVRLSDIFLSDGVIGGAELVNDCLINRLRDEAMR